MAAQEKLGPTTPFEDAFMKYIHTLPEKKKKSTFIASCIGTNNPNTPEALFDSVKEIEKRHSNKMSVKMMRKVLKPVVSELKSFYNIIDTIVQVDPMPAAIIWGGLKIIVNGLGRCFDLFDKIKNELLALGNQLQRMALFEDLYRDSTEMQYYLCEAYINIFRFYYRVDKECSKNSFSMVTRSAFSFNTRKLQSIVSQMDFDANQVAKLAPVVEARMARGEREDAAKERLEAGIEREEARMERLESAQWRQTQQNDRSREIYLEISNWLSHTSSNEAGGREYNLKRHRDNMKERFENTCEWLLDEPKFVKWLDGISNDSVIWVRGGPGAGKSVLCSHAIQHVERLENFTTTAFHFFQTNTQWTSLQTVKSLASQLFEKYWKQKQAVPEHIHNATMVSAADPLNIEEFIKLLIQELPSTHLFLDGLDVEDERQRGPEAANIINMILGLMKSAPTSVKIWFSSQNKHQIREKLQQFPTINVQEQTCSDVGFFLSQVVPSLHKSEVDEDTRKWILIEIQHRARGNFLFAKLMVKAVEEEVGNVDDMRHFIEDGLPMDLDAYYERAFSRYEDQQRAIVCKAFSILTFARRPFRLTELMDAIGTIDKYPFKAPLTRFLAPMIDVQQDPQDQNDLICHIFHSTLRTFLLNHPTVFRQNVRSRMTIDLSITSFAIANACLSYLAQPKYSKILTKIDGRWLTSTGEDIMENHFLTYSVKFWDKHMQHGDDFPDMSSLMEKFLRSTNFVTTLQVQSLCMYRAFGTLPPTIRKVMRDMWQISQDKTWGVHSSQGFWTRYAGPFRDDYNDLLFEWKYFLHRPTCYDERCRKSPFQGEVDRVLWNILGHENFLKRNVSRYTSFILDAPPGTLPEPTLRYWEAFSDDGAEAHVLRLLPLPSDDESYVLFSCQNWDLRTELPTLVSINRIRALKKAIEHDKYWPIGIQYPGGEEAPKGVAFSGDLNMLRIGSQIFIKSTDGEFLPSFSFGFNQTGTELPLEEFAASRSYVALATRLKKQTNKNDDASTVVLEASGKPEILLKQQETDSSDNESSRSSDNDWLEFDSASESWSEGSTDVEEETESEDETPSGATKGSRSSSVSSSASEKVTLTREELFKDSDDETDEDPLDDKSSSDESDDSSSDESSSGKDSVRRPSNRIPGQKVPMNTRKRNGLLLIYDVSSLPSPRLLFRFRRPFPMILKDSPPVFHPSKPLLVWPLFGGEILFADFQLNTFFSRKVRVSGRNTRLVSTCCFFSPDKETLHTASIEAQNTTLMKMKPEDKATVKDAPRTVKIFAIIATYQLSMSKTSRSPPTLIHHTKLHLGDCTVDSLARSPATFTWTSDFLYLTCSGNQLSVYRIALFRDELQRGLGVLVPTLPIYLPDSARIRDVRYFPPNSSFYPKRGTITISSRSPAQELAIEWVVAGAKKICANQGSRPLTSISPPAGIFVDEDEDLGGWEKSEDVIELVEEGFGDGTLNRRLEFEGAEDCIFESFLF